MKKALILLMFCVAGFTFVACSSDDNNGFVSNDEKLVLEGQWQLESMDFLNEKDVEWDTQETPYSPMMALGYAPFMFDKGQISGFSFVLRDVNDEDGNRLGDRFDYIMRGFTPPANYDKDEEYWYWNYKDDNKSFEVKQIQTHGGPISEADFSLYNIREIKVFEEGTRIEFTADLTTRVVGGDKEDTIKTPVHYTLIQGAPTKFVKVLIDGVEYETPVNPEN